MNEDKRIIGVFQNEAELFSKIEELTLNGYSEDDMYVITEKIMMAFPCFVAEQM